MSSMQTLKNSNTVIITVLLDREKNNSAGSSYT